MRKCAGSKSPTVRSQILVPPARWARISAAIFRICDPESPSAIAETRAAGDLSGGRRSAVSPVSAAGRITVVIGLPCGGEKARGQPRIPRSSRSDNRGGAALGVLPSGLAHGMVRA
jgi:hypothetical protein